MRDENMLVDEEVDIVSSAPYPGWMLSNLTPHAFTVDGASCASMEGLLQSLKCPDPDLQAHIRALVGRRAKRAGQRFAWPLSGELHWAGEVVDRLGPEYQRLLDRAYAALAEQSVEFRRALLATGPALLTHSIGLSDPMQTVLTADELCTRLMAIRSQLDEGRDLSRPAGGAST